jgi:molybdopterin molybdotransferase
MDSDFENRSHLLGAGCRIAPAAVALALLSGHARLAVRRKPRIAIVQTGDELVDPQAQCEEHQLVASNGPMIAAMLTGVPCTTHLPAVAPDALTPLLQSLDACSGADVIVTIGGASVGDHDLVRKALMRWGASHEFWGVAVKPGKPLLVATRGSQIVLGLPGNPVSAFVTAFLFLLPLLRHMLGASEPMPSFMHLPTGCSLPDGGTRREFLRARLERGVLQLSGTQHSNMVHGLAHSTHLIDRASGAPALAQGSMVRCYSLF